MIPNQLKIEFSHHEEKAFFNSTFMPARTVVVILFHKLLLTTFSAKYVKLLPCLDPVH